MKKVVSLLIALMLCLTVVAFAESVPSKTTGDLTTFAVASDKIPADSNFCIAAEAEDQDKVQACETEIAALKQAGAANYFGEVKNAAGEAIDLAAELGVENVNVYEMVPVVASNYDASYGAVQTTMQFSTPYAAGEKVIVLIGSVTVNADNTQTVEWVAYEGVGVGTDGAIQVELDADIIASVQGGNSLIAVVSK